LKRYFLKRTLRLITVFGIAALYLQSAYSDTLRTPRVAGHDAPPKLALAKTYHPRADLSAYWLSEKLDGVRAYWNGKHLLSRSGQIYAAPAWFTHHFPSQPLDGELWIGRGQFEKLVSTVRKRHSVDTEWKQVRYMVFDLPTSKLTFNSRIKQLQGLLDNINNPFIQLIKQSRVANHRELMRRLDQVIASHGEGLMLHHGNALYRAGRTSDLLKIKRFQDAEAIVLAHLPGRGKYRQMLGALLVETENGKRFRIGSGFSDAERRNPPPIGAVITFQYSGITQHGIPKFARFARIRHCPAQLPGCSSKHITQATSN